MCRADGSIKCKSSVGTTNIVATDFNPLMINNNEKQSSIGTIHITVMILIH
jgi:ubiquinone/menaquinone biosynthesis C-methylase UbiE